VKRVAREKGEKVKKCGEKSGVRKRGKKVKSVEE